MKRIFKHPVLARSYSTEAAKFVAARDFLLQHRTDYDTAYREFKWPQLKTFNWARDYFDEMAKDNHEPALWVVNESGEHKYSFEQMRVLSNQVANLLESSGFKPFDRIMLMLPNTVELWVWMLAVIKTLGIMVPTATALAPKDIHYRMKQADIKYVVTTPQYADKFDSLSDLRSERKFLVGKSLPGWRNHNEVESYPTTFSPLQESLTTASLLYYFTSGTTGDPKLAIHTRRSYPVGHLSTMYALGVRPGDVHLNISTPGWAKHSWSSFFAPWNAGACIFSYGYQRFDTNIFLNTLSQYLITSLCVPPAVWRMLSQMDNLHQYRTHLKEVVSAGEPLNPVIFHLFKKAWGIHIREIYGLTEVTATLGYSPGQEEKIIPGTMGYPLPGYQVELKQGNKILEGDGEGEIIIKVNPAVTPGYQDRDQTNQAIQDGYLHTGDLASRSDNRFKFFSRKKDALSIFIKSSGYQVSPFPIESKLLEHSKVSEVAVVASPHPIKGDVCKAVIVLKEGVIPDAKLAEEMFKLVKDELPVYQQIAIIEFKKYLPQTVSLKTQKHKLKEDEFNRVEGRSESSEPRLIFYAPDVQKTNSDMNSLRM